MNTKKQIIRKGENPVPIETYNKNNSKFEPERRWMEVRAVGEGDEMRIEGYALKFEKPATHKWGKRKFTEVIKSGALNKTNMKDVPMRYNHNDNVLIMARTRNKSLLLTIDDIGLKVTAILIDTQSNRDLYKAIQEGLIDKMSFAFNVTEGGDTWTYKEDETFREINNIERLFDVAVVDMPFYDDTTIYARSFEMLDSMEKRLDSKRDAEVLKLKIELKRKVN